MNQGWLAAASGALLTCLATGAAAQPSNEACEARVNDTPKKLIECIRKAPLYAHLQAFQAIADANPGTEGHGNRDTGQPGYLASVDYVAGKLRSAGYQVTLQSYAFPRFELLGAPRLSIDGHELAPGRDWRLARLSGSGALTAPIAAVGALASAPGASSPAGCSPRDFAGFSSGDIALMERGGCAPEAKIANAQAAGALAVLLFNAPPLADSDALKGEAARPQAADLRLQTPAAIPVIGYLPFALGAELHRRASAGARPLGRLEVRARTTAGVDENVIADSRFGDPKRVVVVEGHLDSIYGAGILDNATGSATILEIALKLANTPTVNHLRFIWFGGEELGLYGSKFYTRHLKDADLAKIAFDFDVDVTATPNYAILVADPQKALDVARFPPNVVPQSQVGNRLLFNYFHGIGLPARDAKSGNGGTNSRSFALAGVPDTGVLTQQDCCKSPNRVALWGGFLGNYEGKIPSFDGGCVDQPDRWCDNIDNVDPALHEVVSRAAAFVTLKLADDPDLPTR